MAKSRKANTYPASKEFSLHPQGSKHGFPIQIFRVPTKKPNQFSLDILYTVKIRKEIKNLPRKDQDYSCLTWELSLCNRGRTASRLYRVT